MRNFTRSIRKYVFASLAMCIGIAAVAQRPNAVGTNLADGNYIDVSTTNLGLFNQYRVQATSSAASGARIIEFPEYVGQYYNVWRSYSSGLTLAGYNIIIPPTGATAGANWNSNSGGASILLPAIDSGYYYTVNVMTNLGYANDTMAILRTIYNPVTVTSLSIPVDTNEVGPSCSPTIIATLSAPPSAGEYVYLRYSVNGFADSSTVILMTVSSDTATCQIPAYPAGTNVQYYVMTSPNPSLIVTGPASGYYDCQTLNLKTGSIGNNFRYTVKTLPVPSVSITASQNPICAGVTDVFTAHAVNAGTVAPDFQWYKDGNPVGTNDSIYTDAALNNNDSVWVVMTANLVCLAYDTSNHIVITVNPAPTISATASPATICLGDTSLAVGSSSDAPINGFQGAYDAANWVTTTTLTDSSVGYVDTTNTPTLINLYVKGTGGTGTVNFSITVPATGTIAFDWETLPTSTGTVADYPTYVLNGVQHEYPGFSNAMEGTQQNGTFSITVNAGDVFGVQANLSAGTNGYYSFSVFHFSYTGDANITWYNAPTGGTLLGTGDILTVVPAAAGNDTVYAQGSSMSGCTSIARYPVVITVNPLATYAQYDTICQGTAFAEGTHSYTTNGIYVDTFTNASVSGCDSVVTTNLTVLPLTYDSVYIVASQLSYCNTVGTDTFIAVPIGGGPNPTYQWTLGEMYAATGDTFISGAYNAATGDSLAGYSIQVTMTSSAACPTMAQFASNPIVVSEYYNSLYTQYDTTCQGSSFTENGNTYTMSGTYMDTFVNASVYGCDSIVTTNLYVTPTATYTQNPSFCQGGSVTVGPNTYTASGNYTDTLHSAAVSGCDSIVYTNVTVLQPSTYTQSPSICQGSSFMEGTHTYTVNGTYTDTLSSASANGCDSIVTTNLTVVPAVSYTQNPTFCGSGSVTVGPNTYTTTGNYTDTLANASATGCDSIVYTNLTINPIAAYTQYDTVCYGSSFMESGNTYTMSGSYMDTFTNASVNGCDSIVTTNLYVLPQAAYTQYDTICQGSSFTENGHTYTMSGTYMDTFAHASTYGCDSIVTTNLYVAPTATYTQNPSFCQGGSVTVGPNTYTASGSYTDTLHGATASGCDSIVYTNVTVLQPSAYTQSIMICQGSSYTEGTHTYNTNGTYTDTLSNASANGCDSIVTTNLNVVPAVSYTQNPTFCGSGSVTVGPNTYTTTGSYTDTLFNAAVGGCDSIVHTNLTINPYATYTQYDTICQGSSFTENGHTYTMGGTYMDTFTNASVNGCDSIVTTNLFVKPSAAYTQSISFCQGGSITVGPNTYTASGNYTDTLHGAAANGCDSIVMTNVTANPVPTQPTTEPNQSVCPGTMTVADTFSGSGANTTYNWTASGPAIGMAADSGTNVLPSFTGVNTGTMPLTDTIIVTPVFLNMNSAYVTNFGNSTVSVVNTITGQITATIPVGNEPEGVSVSPDGSHVYVANRDDNTVSVISTASNTVTATISVGNLPVGIDVTPDGNYVYVANYQDNNVSVISTATNAVIATIGIGNGPWGLTVSPDGRYVYVTNRNDMTIFVISTASNTVTASIVVGNDPFAVAESPDGSHVYVANRDDGTVSVISTASNTVTTTITVGNSPWGVVVSPNNQQVYVANQSDNTVSVINAVNNTVTATIPVSAGPDGLSLSADGSTLYASCESSGAVSVISTGSNTVTNTISGFSTPVSFGNFLLSGNSCTGPAQTFTITVNPMVTYTQNPVICQGGSVTVGIHTYDSTGTYTDTLFNASVYGCDSIVTTHLTVNPTATYTQYDSICQGSSFMENGHTYTMAGTYIDTFTNASVNGCDSTVTTNLYVRPQSVYTQYDSICQGSSFMENGHTYTIAGTYTDTFTSASVYGCDSIVTTNLFVAPLAAYTQYDTICSGSGFPENGHTYTMTGTYMDTFASASVYGCDSIVTTNLYVTPPVTYTQYDSICQGSTFTENGHIYTMTNTYMDTFYSASVSGCDSVVTTNLYVYPLATYTQYDTICQGGTFTENGNNYTATNTYVDTFSNASVHGCDSIVTTNLYVYPLPAYTQYDSICQGSSFTENGHSYTMAGSYMDTFYNASATGCDSIVTTDLYVNPTPTVNYVNSQGICANSQTSTVSFSGSIPGTVYSWTGSNGTIGISTSGMGDIASFTGTNTDSTVVIDTIIVTPSYTNGTVTCTGVPDTFTISVDPTPTVNTVNSQVVCNNSPTATVSFSGAVAGTSYNWTGSIGTIGLATSGTGDISSFIATDTTNLPVTDTIIVTPTIYDFYDNTCTGTPDTFTITVNPTPTVNPVSNQQVCNNTATSAISFTGAVTGTVYNWTGSNGTIGLATSGTGDIASFNATNSGSVAVTDTIIVTPGYTNLSTTCTGAADTFTITVNPTPVMATPADQAVCNGNMTATVTFTSSVPGTAYTWTGSNSTIGLATAGSGDIASFTAINTGTTDVIDTITVTPTSPQSCTGAADTFYITVHPSPQINLGPNVIQCGGNVIVDAGNPGSTYLWSDNNTTEIDTISTSGTYTVTVTTIYGCTASGSKTVYIKSAPVVNLGPDQSTCSDSITLDAGNPGEAYLWTGGNTTEFLTVYSSGTYSVTVTDTASGCSSSDSVSVIIGSKPVVTLGNDTATCSGPIILSAGPHEDYYLWSNGDTTNTIVVNTTGNYSVTVTNAYGCTASSSILVTIYPKPNLGPDVTDSICPHSRADLYNYYQNSGLMLTYSTPTPASVDSGTYTVIGTNSNGCMDTALITIIYRQAPSAGGNKTDSVCPGYTYNLTTLYPNVGYSSYTWNTPDPTAVAPGIYTLVVSGANGCSDTATATILTRTKPNLGGNKTDSVCRGYTYDLAALYPDNGYTTYTWTGVANDSAVAPGVYQLIATNASGCGDTAYATILQRAQPIVTIPKYPNVCSTTPAYTLTGATPAGGTYYVDYAADSVFNTPVLGPGVHHVSYIYTNGSGCTDSASTSVTIYPQPQIVDTAVLPTLCSGAQLIDLNNYFSPGGGVFSGPGVNGNYFYPSLAPTGADSITYIYTDQNGCIDTGGGRISVIPSVHVSLHTTQSNFTVCAGQPITFTASGAVDYQFFVNDSAVTTLDTTSTFTSSTLPNHAQVTVVGTNGCSSDTSDFIIIDVNGGPTVTVGPDTTITLGQTVQLYSNVSGSSAVIYMWTPDSSLNVTNIPNPVYSGSDTIIFQLKVTDANGCTAVAYDTIDVYIPDNIQLPNVITPNGDGKNDVWQLDPKIDLAGSHLIIFNRWGEVVYETYNYNNDWGGTYKSTGHKVPDGTYYYVLTVPNPDNHTYKGPINVLDSSGQ
jgi:gliding motility-associated-like protein